MDVDSLTIGTTEYEDMLIGDTGDNVSSEGAAYNYTALESMVTDAWETARERTPGVQLHEAAVLMLSALVVGVHGLLGVLPRSLLSPRTAWLLLQAALAMGCVYALGCLALAVHGALYRWFFRDAEDAEDDEQEQEADEQAECTAGEDDGAVESVVSSRIEKEERVKRWLDNLSTDPVREQINLEACGEVRGRNMEADRSSADLLGDGQPTLAVPANAAPRPARLLTLPPPPLPKLPQLPATLPSAELASLSVETRRALSLAYELSLAVRSRPGKAPAVRTTMSAPVSDSGGLSLADAKEDWKLVRLGKEDLNQSQAPVRSSEARTQATAASRAPSSETTPPDASPRTPRQDEDSRTPEQGSAPITPTASILASAAPNAAVSDNAVLNPSSSLLNFVRRFSGTRFLLRELANATDGLPIPGLVLPGLRLKDSRSLSLEQQRPERPERPEPSHHRSALALPRVDVQAAAPHREKVMKVFSKGLLSEGGPGEFPAAAAHPAHPAQDAVLGAAGFLAQDSSGLPRATRTTATCTAESEAAVCPARSALNLDVAARPRATADGQDVAGYVAAAVLPVTTSRGLTANMSEEGIPRPARPDLDDEHKSLFDLRKSLLTSIPEAAPPEEDLSHF